MGFCARVQISGDVASHCSIQKTLPLILPYPTSFSNMVRGEFSVTQHFDQDLVWNKSVQTGKTRKPLRKTAKLLRVSDESVEAADKVKKRRSGLRPDLPVGVNLPQRENTKKTAACRHAPGFAS
jgi:hypothetical protein